VSEIYDLFTYSLTHSMVQDIFLKSWLSLCLSKNILLYLWNPKVRYRVHKITPLDPILSQLNPVRPIDPPIFKSHVLFQLLRSCQRISPDPGRFETSRNKINFYGELPHAQPPSWRTIPCRLSATVYSVYSKLPSVSEAFPPIAASWRYVKLYFIVIKCWTPRTIHVYMSLR
jgi:hypothetical protein